MSNTSQLIWQDPNWRKQVMDWIHTQAERQNIHITSEIEQPHTYAWSTVLHVPTDQGKLFFKATAQETVYEAALTQSLSRWFTDLMPEFVSVDTSLGYMLMRVGGDELRAASRQTHELA